MPFIPQHHFHEYNFNDYGKMLCKRWAYQPLLWCPKSSVHKPKPASNKHLVFDMKMLTS